MEDLKMKVEEIQASKDPMKGENDKLQSEVKTNKPQIKPESANYSNTSETVHPLLTKPSQYQNKKIKKIWRQGLRFLIINSPAGKSYYY